MGARLHPRMYVLVVFETAVLVAVNFVLNQDITNETAVLLVQRVVVHDGNSLNTRPISHQEVVTQQLEPTANAQQWAI